jgi:hypothetical protein
MAIREDSEERFRADDNGAIYLHLAIGVFIAMLFCFWLLTRSADTATTQAPTSKSEPVDVVEIPRG